MITEKQQKQLMADLPASAVEQRQGGGRRQFSYVPRFYVYDQLNQIFGPGGWGYTIDSLELVVPPHDVETKTGKSRSCSYLCRATLTVEGGVPISDVGYGSGIDPKDGAAIESASKEAVTDAVKRCASALGRRLGGALYQKSQEHVTDVPAETVPVFKAPSKQWHHKPLPEIPDEVLAKYREIVAKATEDPARREGALADLADVDAEIATRPSMTGQKDAAE